MHKQTFSWTPYRFIYWFTQFTFRCLGIFRLLFHSTAVLEKFLYIVPDLNITIETEQDTSKLYFGFKS